MAIKNEIECIGKSLMIGKRMINNIHFLDSINVLKLDKF